MNLVRKHSPLMVLSSLDLPRLDGYKLCQTLRELKETEGIPFMFILPAGEFPDRLIGHESYAHDYIQKPISIPEFGTRVKALLNLVSGFPVQPQEPQVQDSLPSLKECHSDAALGSLSEEEDEGLLRLRTQ